MAVIRSGRCVVAGVLVWVGVACAAGCGAGALQDRDASATGGTSVIIGGTGGAAGGGSLGGAGPPLEPCVPDSDPRLVIVPQRTLLLSSTQLVNMLRVLIDDTEARAIVDEGVFPVTTDIQSRFPPPTGDQFRQIPDAGTMRVFTNLAQHAARYVFDNFARLTGCAPAVDNCARTYRRAFAEKAYRRPLDAHEQSDLDRRYSALRNSGTIEEATRDVIAAILTAPQFLYRSEMGDGDASLSPPGLPLTPYELASALSFFLTDGPPDQALLDDARAGTLSATLPAHADRLLATPVARAWLTTVVETLLEVNQLPATIIDTGKFPEVNAKLLADMQTEARLFLGDVLWNANLADLLLSPTTYLNANLARTVYQVPVPAGATETDFVRVTLPADQRSGILTNPGVLTTRSRSDGVSVVPRGLGVNSLLLGRDSLPTPPVLIEALATAWALLPSQTAQQEVAYRSSMPACASCHVDFDPYGLALDNYDVIGRFRTIDDLGKPVDARATLGPALGGVSVAGAIDLARVLAQSPAFANTMARHMLSYALLEPIESPDPSTSAAGCVVAGVVHRFETGGAKTFSGLMRAIALSPAFSHRLPAP